MVGEEKVNFLTIEIAYTIVTRNVRCFSRVSVEVGMLDVEDGRQIPCASKTPSHYTNMEALGHLTNDIRDIQLLLMIFNSFLSCSFRSCPRFPISPTLGQKSFGDSMMSISGRRLYNNYLHDKYSCHRKLPIRRNF